VFHWAGLVSVGGGLLLVASLVGVSAGAGFAAGALRRRLDDREIALLLDRVLGTGEVLVTAVGLGDRSDPAADEVFRAAARVVPPPGAIRRALPIRLPRALRWTLPLAVAVVAAMALAPRAREIPGASSNDTGSKLIREGRTLAGRIAEVREEHPELALPAAGEDLDRLAKDLQGGELSPEEAASRLKEAQGKLDALNRELAPSQDLLKQLEQAAGELDDPATAPLGRALKDGDFATAADEARKLPDRLADASPAERERAAENLERAGEQLEKGAPEARPVAKGLEQAGRGARRSASAGSRDGAPSAGDGELSPEEAQDLAEQIEQARDLGQRLRRDQQAIEQAQRLNGAAERTASALGEPGEQPGEDGAQASAGRGHTWEDEGESDSPPDHQDADRNTSREGGKTADDFQRFYAPVRPYEGQGGQLASVPGRVDEDGHVDQVTLELTGAPENASSPRLSLPAEYHEAATRALSDEEIPPGYRGPVREYFDGFK
jgi:hypothetical protein